MFGDIEKALLLIKVATFILFWCENKSKGNKWGCEFGELLCFVMWGGVWLNRRKRRLTPNESKRVLNKLVCICYNVCLCWRC